MMISLELGQIYCSVIGASFIKDLKLQNKRLFCNISDGKYLSSERLCGSLKAELLPSGDVAGDAPES
jgi:hypothetical protein